MYKFFLTAILCLVGTNVQAQIIGTATPDAKNQSIGMQGTNNTLYSSTAEEGTLRGLGAYFNGVGSYLESVGRYYSYYEVARKQYLLNLYTRNQIRWAITDEWTKRYKENNPGYIAKENARLDMLEQMAALELRKDKLRASGVLPPKPVSSFKWKGYEFSSYAKFKQSPIYAKFLKECVEKEEKRLAEIEIQRNMSQENIEFLKRHDQMSFSQREQRKFR